MEYNLVLLFENMYHVCSCVYIGFMVQALNKNKPIKQLSSLA